MKVKVEKDDCISCGLCVNDVSEVFAWDDEDKAEAISGDVPKELKAAVEDAIEGCPTDAIVEV